MNQPDNWILLEIDNGKDKKYHKVLAGWSGGYLDGDSWKLNSGIEKVEENMEGYYDFIGSSGSVYRCHKNQEMVRMNIGGVLSSLLKEYPDIIKEVEMGDIKDEYL